MAVKPAARRKPRIQPLRARRALAARLQAFRGWLGLTQQGLAGAAGVSRATIARWEAGTSPLPAWLAGPMIGRPLFDCWLRPRGDQDAVFAGVVVATMVNRSIGQPQHDVLGAAIRARDVGSFREICRALGVVPA